MAASRAPAGARKAVIAGAVGNTMEWFDFGVYAYFATIIATLFFPSEDPVASLLASFAVFAVAFFMRPLGALIFGHFGDRIGRRNTLAAAIILMAVATFLIGILPTYEQIGVLAPILLVLARLLQGLSAGGEWGGSASFMVEFAPEGRRGFFGSWQQFSVVGGLLLGSATGALLTSTLSEAALNSWGWRVPFLIGLLLGLVGLYIRLQVDETPEFRAVIQNREVAAAPIRETLRGHNRAGLVAIGFTLVWTVAYYLLLTYMPTYVSQTLEISASLALISNTIGLVFLMALIPVMGALSDRIGRKPMLIGAAVGLAVLTYPMFLLISQGSFVLIVLAQIVFAVLIAMYSGPGPAALVEMFPTNVRYSALGVSYNLSVAVFGGTAPFIATFLINRTGSDLSPTFYMILAAVITLAVLIRIQETYRSRLLEA